jgi:CheY-like chemotaxis protein
VLTDIGLLGMDGYAVASALLAAVTGYGRDEDISRSRSAGFDHHLIKPVDLASLQRITAAAPGNALLRFRSRSAAVCVEEQNLEPRNAVGVASRP